MEKDLGLCISCFRYTFDWISLSWKLIVGFIVLSWCGSLGSSPGLWVITFFQISCQCHIFHVSLGALFVHDPETVTPVYPIFYGGGQERNFRPGTENTGMIAGLGEASQLVVDNLDQYHENMKMVRECYGSQQLSKAFSILVLKRPAMLTPSGWTRLAGVRCLIRSSTGTPAAWSMVVVICCLEWILHSFFSIFVRN